MPGLFDPIAVGPTWLRNRIVMPPMANNRATEDGRMTDWHVEHYGKRAAGLGLMIVEHSYVQPDGLVNRNQTGIHDDEMLEGLSRVVGAVHAAGAPIVIQLTHGGSQTTTNLIGKQPLGPSDVRVPGGTEDPRPFTLEEIDQLVASFVAAARRAKAAGFDGVEVHGAHGYLLNQFLSPLTNKRTDEYGGSPEKRMALPLRVVREVKAAVGDRMVVLFRLGGDDGVEGGLTINDAVPIAQALVGAGVDLIDVSGGFQGSRPPKFHGKMGYFVPLATEVKKAVKVPVLVTGGISDPNYADELVRSRRTDLVGVGRAMLTDPLWAVKARFAGCG